MMDDYILFLFMFFFWHQNAATQYPDTSVVLLLLFRRIDVHPIVETDTFLNGIIDGGLFVVIWIILHEDDFIWLQQPGTFSGQYHLNLTAFLVGTQQQISFGIFGENKSQPDSTLASSTWAGSGSSSSNWKFSYEASIDNVALSCQVGNTFTHRSSPSAVLTFTVAMF